MSNPQDPKMLKWLYGGTGDANRSMEFHPWSHSGPGLDGVRCILKASRGSTSTAGGYQERTATGTGETMEAAFQAAYQELVGWLL